MQGLTLKRQMVKTLVKTLLISHKNPTNIDLFANGGRCEPLPLVFLAAYLKKYHYPVEILDANVFSYSHQKILQEIKKKKPDLVGLSATTPDFGEAIKLAKKIKKITDPPLTVIGGTHVSAVPTDIQKYPYFDFGVIGEGEVTLLELIKEIDKAKNGFNHIKGLCFLKKGKLVITPPRPRIKNLDALPFPSRELLPPLSSYHPSPGMYHQLPMAFMITSRGCPYHCIFCCRGVFGNLYRARSAKNVVDEMEMLVKDFGVREIRICDDLFCLNEQRALDVCREIKKRHFKVSWGCSGRADLVTKRMLKAFAKVGCWEVSYGIESGSQEMLNTIKKNLTLEIIKKAIRMTKDAGLEARGYFMLGLPGDNQKTMQRTIDFAKVLKLDTAQFFITIPFPGTELLNKAEQYGKVDRQSLKNYLNQTTTNPPFVPYTLTARQIIKYFRKAYREFFLRPSYLLNKLMKIKSWVQLKAYVQAFFSISQWFLND